MNIAPQRRLRTSHLDTILSSIVALTASQFYYIWAGQTPEYLRRYALIQNMQRPYVYRALVPLLARALSGVTGLKPEISIMVWVVLSAVGLYFALIYLQHTFKPDQSANVQAFIVCEALFILSTKGLPYDFSTSLFFIFSLALLARRNTLLYLVLFPIATLNRETTFLLTLVWLATSYNKLPKRDLFYGTLYQGLVWILIRIFTSRLYADNPGAPFAWQPMKNLSAYATHPLGTVALLIGVSIILVLIFRGWAQKPAFLRTAFLFMFPTQIFLHLTMGAAWEFRVYAESLSFGFLLVLWGLSNQRYEAEQDASLLPTPQEGALVPLDLLPSYHKIHVIEPYSWNEKER